MIEFTITITESDPSKPIDFRCETKDAPEATLSEINYAKQFNLMVAMFREQMSATKMPSPKRFHKSYGRGSSDN